MSCTVPYIPARLHAGDRPDLPQFRIGELLYRRCIDVDEPFDKISLQELSVNRQGPKEAPFCEQADVLFNLHPENDKGEILDENIVALEIKELDATQTYSKTLEQPEEGLEQPPKVYRCRIVLLHDKLPCNYAHCIFRLYFDETIVTSENYKQTIGHKKSAIYKLKVKVKLEFATMIHHREVRIHHQ